MNKSNIILIIISVILFCVAIGVIFYVMKDEGVIPEPEEVETVQEKIDRKTNEVKERPTTEGINVNEVEEILEEKNSSVNEFIGEDEGVVSTDEELVYVGQNELNQSKDSINKNYTDFTVDTASEQEGFSFSNYEGKPIVLMFWRSDVADAIETLNSLNTAYEEYGEDVHFVCIDVAIGETSSKEDVENYIAANDIKVDMYYDTPDNNAVNPYNITYVPSVVFIDRNRNVINTKVGLLSYDALEANLDLLVGNF